MCVEWSRVGTKINKRTQKFARLSSQIGFVKIEKECRVPHSNRGRGEAGLSKQIIWHKWLVQGWKSKSADCFGGPNGGLRFVETAVAANDDEDIKAMLLNVMEAPKTKFKPSTPDSYCSSSESERVNASSSVLTALESEDCVGPGAETCSLCLCLVRLVPKNLAYDFSNEWQQLTQSMKPSPLFASAQLSSGPPCACPAIKSLHRMAKQMQSTSRGTVATTMVMTHKKRRPASRAGTGQASWCWPACSTGFLPRNKAAVIWHCCLRRWKAQNKQNGHQAKPGPLNLLFIWHHMVIIASSTDAMRLRTNSQRLVRGKRVQFAY